MKKDKARMNFYESHFSLKLFCDKCYQICINRNISFLLQYICGKPEQALFTPSSSASSGTDSSLRIRKTRAGCTERRWFICVSLAMIFTVLVASAGIYFGCKINLMMSFYFTLELGQE